MRDHSGVRLVTAQYPKDRVNVRGIGTHDRDIPALSALNDTLFQRLDPDHWYSDVGLKVRSRSDDDEQIFTHLDHIKQGSFAGAVEEGFIVHEVGSIGNLSEVFHQANSGQSIPWCAWVVTLEELVKAVSITRYIIPEMSIIQHHKKISYSPLLLES